MQNKSVLSLIILECNQFFIEINLFHNRNKFLYITTPFKSAYRAKWFNDVPRAMAK